MRQPRAVLVSAVVLVLVAAGVVVSGSPGGAQEPMCFGQPVEIFAEPGVVTVGTADADVILGTAGDDVIRGLGGNDRICSRAGDDRVFSGAGADRVNLGPGDDVANGGGGADLILGKAGRDIINGKAGRDVLKGGGAFDTLVGGKHDDDLLGQAGADWLRGNAGDDDLTGGRGIDQCEGGPGSNAVASCNENTPFGPNPFVGWWTGIEPDGLRVTTTIDPAGGTILTGDLSTGFCPDRGLFDAAWTARGAGQQVDPTGFNVTLIQVTCVPDGQPPSVFPAAIPLQYTYDVANDTISLPDGDPRSYCSWRRGSTSADCES